MRSTRGSFRTVPLPPFSKGPASLLSPSVRSCNRGGTWKCAEPGGPTKNHARGQASFKSPLDPVLSTLDFQFVRMQCHNVHVPVFAASYATLLQSWLSSSIVLGCLKVNLLRLTISQYLQAAPPKQPKNLIINQFPCSYLLVSSTLETLETNFTYGWTCHAKGEELKRNTQKFVGFKVKTYSALSEQPVFIFCGAQSFPAKISLNSFDYDCRVVL